MIPGEFKSFVDQLVSIKVAELESELMEKITELTNRIHKLEIDLEIQKEGENI